MLKAVPVSFKDACAFVNEKHRHHIAPVGDKYRVGCADEYGKLHGVAMVGNPVSRMLCDGKTLEVLRLCTDGTKGACSFLYSRCARIAREMGYERIITYILESESGASLVSAGWQCEAKGVGGGSWNRPSRERELSDAQVGLFETKDKYPTEKKQRWEKKL